MYRIRSASGTEAVYHSLDEFSAAVHRGEVHPEDEIFHTRANRWLDVKSHPHYRSALDWTGPTTGGSVPAQASTPPRQVASTAPAAAPPARAQVFERPHIKSPQTTLRPQLQAAPGVKLQAPAASPAAVQPPTAVAPAPKGPLPKSRDLNFVDLGDGSPARGHAAVAEPLKKVNPPVAAPAEGPSELEFLVMDGGIESPVRSSSGHRTIPDDLDLLFDTPLEATEKPLSGRVSTGKVPKVASAPARPAKPEPSAPSPTPKPVAAAPAPAPKVEPRPENATAAPIATPAPAPAPAPAPVVVARVTTAENLAIPGGPLAASEADFPAEPQQAPAPAGAPRSHTLMIVGIVVSLAASGGLLAWHPWSAGGATPAMAVESGPPASTESAPPAPTAGQPGDRVATPGSVPASGAATKLVTPAPPSASVAKADSSVIKPQEETVIAAVRPNFSSAVNVRATDLGLGGDVHSSTAVAAVSPSELTRRLEASERQAEQELQSRLAAAGFRNVFAGDRLATSDGVAGARAAWSTGSEAIRQFRARVTRLEQAYEDSVLSSQRAQKWPGEEMRSFASHQSPAEPSEVSQLSDLMMSQVSEALEILAALDGEYTLKSGAITFRTPASATRFTGIRGWVEQRMQTWQAIPEGARPRSISSILRGLGDGLPSVR